MPAAETSPNHGAVVRLVQDALDRDNPEARRQLISAMAPVVRGRVRRAIFTRLSTAKGRALRPDIEDLTQEVYVVFFARDAHILRAWDPSRGLSFLGYVGLVAERHTLGILRTAKRNPWTEDSMPVSTIESLFIPAVRSLRQLESRSLIYALTERMQRSLSPMGLRYYRMLFLEQMSAPQVAEAFGVSLGSIYVWRSRIAQALEEARSELEAECKQASDEP